MNKKVFLIIVLFLLVFSLGVYAADPEFPCGKAKGSEGYKCVKGDRVDLEKKYSDCKEGKVCDKEYCCGDSDGIYCCKSYSCETTFEGYQCTIGGLEELRSKGYDCKNSGGCNGKDCCGTSSTLRCCKKSDVSSGSNPFDFGSISGINQRVSEYRGLNYFDLQERSSDQKIKIQALYSEALGYKEIAILRREYLGVPLNVLVQESQYIKKTGSSSGSSSNEETTTQEQSSESNKLNSGSHCGNAEGYFCVKEDEGTNCFNSNPPCSNGLACCKPGEKKVIPKKEIETRGLIIRAGESIYEGYNRVFFSSNVGFWSWCKTNWENKECDTGYKRLMESYTSPEILKVLRGKNYDEGIDELLYSLIKHKVLTLGRGEEVELFIPKLSTRGSEYHKLVIKDSSNEIILEFDGIRKCSQIVDLSSGSNTFINEAGIIGRKTQIQNVQRNPTGYKCALDTIKELIEIEK